MNEQLYMKGIEMTIEQVVIDFFNAARDLWGYAEVWITVLSITLGIYLYMRVPLRRNRFFGYRPTIIAVVRSEDGKFLIGENKYGWIFPQGEAPQEETTVAGALLVVDRELGLVRCCSGGTHFDLGKLKVRADQMDTLVDGVVFSLFRRWVGKTYAAAVINTRQKWAMSEITATWAAIKPEADDSMTYLYKQIEFVSAEEALRRFALTNSKGKVEFYRKILARAGKGQTGNLAA